MDTLKKLFPLAFNQKNGIVGLIINLIIHVFADAVAGLIIWLLPILGFLGGLIGLYFTVSAVLSVLDYFKVLK
jgi:hypothetical protein